MAGKDVKLNNLQIILSLGFFFLMIPLGILSIKLNFPIIVIAFALWAFGIWDLRQRHKIFSFNLSYSLSKLPVIRRIQLIIFAVIFFIAYMAFNVAFGLLYIYLFE